ncbi:hypothetical protein DZD52_01295 [Xanthomonas nasturtii]|uniref:Uncharacterized protein n=1 Tax=Xanthomonas nasturtii TaxID=1843581 RepID=A0A3E1KSE6_9XANT|nr:hypothetical protein DZD52_01295 [Xanthomonas nasturtii]
MARACVACLADRLSRGGQCLWSAVLTAGFDFGEAGAALAVGQLYAAIGHAQIAQAETAQPRRCLIPGFDGALFSHEWKEALWARFCMGAPLRQRRSVERYKIVKRA